MVLGYLGIRGDSKETTWPIYSAISAFYPWKIPFQHNKEKKLIVSNISLINGPKYDKCKKTRRSWRGLNIFFMYFNIVVVFRAEMRTRMGECVCVFVFVWRWSRDCNWTCTACSVALVEPQNGQSLVLNHSVVVVVAFFVCVKYSLEWFERALLELFVSCSSWLRCVLFSKFSWCNIRSHTQTHTLTSRWAASSDSEARSEKNNLFAYVAFCSKIYTHSQICKRTKSNCKWRDEKQHNQEEERKRSKKLHTTQCISTLNKNKNTLFYYFWYIYITSW